MKSQILGSQKTLDLVKNATPFNTNIHVNLEALEELPEQFAAVLTPVYFDKGDLEKDFTKISSKYLPKTHLMYKIAEARGVYGSPDHDTHDVYEDVNINPLICKDFEDRPNVQRLHVAVSTTKIALVREDDGSILPGAPCTSIDSFWNDCLSDWASEEEDTQGYDPSIVKNGTYKAFEYGKNVDKNGAHYMKKKGQYTNAVPIKFDTKYKRKSYYEKQKNMALNMTQTKSWLKCIREKAGLITAYDAKDLKDGVLIFSKIVKSSEALKMESLAHLASIEKGTASKESQNLLFGTEKNVTEPIIQTDVGGRETEVPHDNGEIKLTQVEAMIEEIECDIENFVISGELKAQLQRILKWIKDNPNANETPHWKGAVDTIVEMREVLNA